MFYGNEVRHPDGLLWMYGRKMTFRVCSTNKTHGLWWTMNEDFYKPCNVSWNTFTLMCSFIKYQHLKYITHFIIIFWHFWGSKMKILRELSISEKSYGRGILVKNHKVTVLESERHWAKCWEDLASWIWGKWEMRERNNGNKQKGGRGKAKQWKQTKNPMWERFLGEWNKERKYLGGCKLREKRRMRKTICKLYHQLNWISLKVSYRC